MLPTKLRLRLFDRLSVKTMRYVTAVPRSEARGLTKSVYDMIEEDFFINGSLTSRSAVPRLLAGIWTAGRETMLVDDGLDRTTKEAICAVVSDANDCPYCGDMLISLVDAGSEHGAASAIHRSELSRINDPVLRRQLEWVEAVTTPGAGAIPECPFTDEQLPEVLGSMMAMADINRFSHVVMDGSPVNLPLGLQRQALRLFGNELRSTKHSRAVPGRALPLLPWGPLPADLGWSQSNPRIADALARWVAIVERETRSVIPEEVRACVEKNLANWRNERAPLSRRWANEAVSGLTGERRDLAKLALVLARAPGQVSEDLVEPLVGADRGRFVRLLAWAAFTGARAFIRTVVDRLDEHSTAPANESTNRTVAGSTCGC
jgi:alkylhydroperoxidase family enzyme